MYAWARVAVATGTGRIGERMGRCVSRAHVCAQHERVGRKRSAQAMPSFKKSNQGCRIHVKLKAEQFKLNEFKENNDATFSYTYITPLLWLIIFLLLWGFSGVVLPAKIMDKKQGEFTLKQIIQEKAKEETKNIYVNIKLDLIERIRDLDNKIATIKNEISKMKEENKGKKDKILADFKIIMNRLSLKFGIDILNNIKFLEFKTIKTIGTSGKIVTLAVYLAYFELLCKYSSVELPFVLDSVIKEEPDDISMERMFSYIEDKLLKQNRQSFVSMLRDKLHYINGNYNIIDLTKPILNENKYDEVHKSIESLIAEIE